MDNEVGLLLSKKSEKLPWQDRGLFAETVQFGAESDGFVVFVTRNAVRDLREGTRASAPNEAFGLLMGKVFHDRQGVFTVVAGAVYAHHLSASAGHVRLDAQQMGQLRREASIEHPTADFVGWTHSHGTYSSYSYTDCEEQRTWTDEHCIGILTFMRPLPERPWAIAYRGPDAELMHTAVKSQQPEPFFKGLGSSSAHYPTVSADETTAGEAQSVEGPAGSPEPPADHQAEKRTRSLVEPAVEPPAEELTQSPDEPPVEPPPEQPVEQPVEERDTPLAERQAQPLTLSFSRPKSSGLVYALLLLPTLWLLILTVILSFTLLSMNERIATLETQAAHPASPASAPANLLWGCDRQAGTVPLVVQCNGPVGPAIEGWSWNFGDGSQPVATNSASHTYTVAGAYTLTLTVLFSSGSQNAGSLTINIGNRPTPTPRSTPTK